MINRTFLGLSAALLLTLSACGGSSGSATSTPVGNPIGGAALISQNVQATNMNSAAFPWNNIADGMIKRWDYQAILIPVKTKGDPRATAALDDIETKLGFTIFDRLSIANTPDNAIISPALIFSYGTAVDPNGGASAQGCGNVSSAPSSPFIAGATVLPSGQLTGVRYINIDNAVCTAGIEIVTHEVGHALGMGNHFIGFGLGNATLAIDGNFWNVLNTIYTNPIGTIVANLSVNQIIF